MKKLLCYLSIILSLFLYSCGSSNNDSSDSSASTPETPITSEVEITGRAVLGPLSNAGVNFYCPEDLSTPVFTGYTSTYNDNFNNYDNIGVFSYSDNISCSYYIVEVNDGTDVDPDDDGIIDSTSTIENNGKIRSILTEDFFSGSVTVNVLTEITFRILESRLEIGYFSLNDLKKDLDNIAKSLISTDITGDGLINAEDLLSFDPVEHKIYFKHIDSNKSYSDLLPDDDAGSSTFIETIYENIGFNLGNIIDENVTDGLSNIYYRDEDGDGYNDGESAVVSYNKPPGYSEIPPPIVVNTTQDIINPDDGKISLREAVKDSYSNQPIIFDQSLDGSVIYLDKIADNHTILKGEVMGMRMEPSGPVSYLEGFFDRDYGKSALYARKNLILDASNLANGVTLEWDGTPDKYARVLAVYGNLVLKNISVTGGNNKAEQLDSASQPWTLSRGCGVAVWGTARIIDSKIYHNSCQGDFDQARDRGAFGGGVYANIVNIEDSIIGGNTVVGVGAAGGGVYSVGGRDPYSANSIIKRSSISGNLIQGMFAYGGGIYSDGGSIGNQKKITVINSTVTQNLAEPFPGIPSFLLNMGYWRGGGIYMSNGYMEIKSSTIVNNEARGMLRIDDLNKPNIGGGGLAATIGNAHAVEDMKISQSIVAGNTIYFTETNTSKSEDIFTGSLLSFISGGYNLLGKVNFDQILVPVGEYMWRTLIRIHYPKEGDVNNVNLAQTLNLTTGIETSAEIQSQGVDAGNPAILYYQPADRALNKIPDSYSVSYEEGQYNLSGNAEDSDFLNIFLQRLEDHLGVDNLTNNFTSSFEDFLVNYDIDSETAGIQHYTDPDDNPIISLENVNFYGPAETWPANLSNYPYILFWQKLKEYINDNYSLSYNEEILNDGVWDALFSTGYLSENSNIYMQILDNNLNNNASSYDQLGISRPANSLSDIGAVEIF